MLSVCGPACVGACLCFYLALTVRDIIWIWLARTKQLVIWQARTKQLVIWIKAGPY